MRTILLEIGFQLSEVVKDDIRGIANNPVVLEGCYGYHPHAGTLGFPELYSAPHAGLGHIGDQEITLLGGFYRFLQDPGRLTVVIGGGFRVEAHGAVDFCLREVPLDQVPELLTIRLFVNAEVRA